MKEELFSKAKYFYVIDEDNLVIKKIENRHTREQWEDFNYRSSLFLKLSDVKKVINRRKPYTSEGHMLQINVWSDYQVLKSILK